MTASPVVPRIHDSLEIRPIAGPEGAPQRYAIIGADGGELMRVDEQWRFVILQLDGLTGRETVQRRYGARFGAELPEARLQLIIDGLADCDVINDNDQAVWALRYLQEQGVRYRSGVRDRRGGDRSGDGRRSGDSERTRLFDQAVYVLNQGRVDDALEVFREVAAGRPSDVRIGEIIGHLEYLVAAQDKPDLHWDRRDVSWAAFDRALAEMLAAGRCPACGESVVIELGRNNRCSFCGCAFTTHVLHAAEGERRS